MMAVDIEDRDAAGAEGTQALGGQCGIVDVTVAAGPGPERVVTWRTRQRVSGAPGGCFLRRGESAGGGPGG